MGSEIAKAFKGNDSNDEKDHSDSEEKGSTGNQILDSAIPLPVRVRYLPQDDLAELVRSGTIEDYVVIDVRDETMDHSGGHITGSANISDKIFYDSIPEILRKYGKTPSLTVYCMYSQRRSVKCMEFYAKAIEEIIENYDKDTGKSHYFMYSLSNRGEARNVDESGGDMLIRNGQPGWMDQSSTQKRVEIDFVDDDMIQNLTNQKLHVLEGGFFMWINKLKDTDLIEGFDQTHYEQLELRGIFNQKMYYHKKEYFAKKQFMELKKADKSKHFNYNSSSRNLKLMK
eukprot:131378_1